MRSLQSGDTIKKQAQLATAGPCELSPPRPGEAGRTLKTNLSRKGPDPRKRRAGGKYKRSKESIGEGLGADEMAVVETHVHMGGTPDGVTGTDQWQAQHRPQHPGAGESQRIPRARRNRNRDSSQPSG